MKLNLGCGTSKLPGFVNCDADAALNPDVVVDLLKPLPFENESVDLIVMAHAIEHISEWYQQTLLFEFNRVLKSGGELVLTYPEFKKCAQNYIDNFQGKRDFWKATIYGRQLTEWDKHVTLMDTDVFKETLREHGFVEIQSAPEKHEAYNTVLRAKKGTRLISYEEAVVQEFFT